MITLDQSSKPNKSKKRTHYTFHSTSTDTPNQETNTKKQPSNFIFFYQIGGCKNLKTKSYPMRKFVIDVNDNNRIVDIRCHNLNSKQNSNFYILYKPHQYKVYSVSSLEDIKPPTYFDINTANSNILTNSYNYTGNYAPF